MTRAARPLVMGLLKAAAGLAVLAYVVARNWRGDGSAPGLADLVGRPLQPGPLAVAAGLCAAGVGLTFVRWWVLVRAQGLPFALADAVKLGLVGYYFNTLLPGSVGGDLVKAVALARGQARRTAAVATVLFDRVVGLYGLAVLVAVLGGGLWLTGNEVLAENRGLRLIVLGAAVAAGGGWLAWAALGLLPAWRAERFAGRLAGVPKLGGPLAEAWRAVVSYRARTAAVLLALGLALVGHLGFVASFHFAARIFTPPAEAGELPGLAEHFVIVPVGLVIKAAFPAPGGVGGGEFGFGKLYNLLGQPESRGVLASLTQLVLSWALGVFGYAVYLGMGKRSSIPVSEGSVSETLED